MGVDSICRKVIWAQAIWQMCLSAIGGGLSLFFFGPAPPGVLRPSFGLVERHQVQAISGLVRDELSGLRRAEQCRVLAADVGSSGGQPM